jgi:hypothetical protein
MGLVFKLVLLLFVPLELTCAIILAPLLVASFSDINPLAFAVFSTVGVILLTLIAVTLIYKTGTFLRLSPEGLEYHRWPFTTITCRWNEAEKIAQGNVMGMSVATLMIPREKIGWEKPVKGGVLGSAKYKLVPLNDFQGWPDGDLMNELRQYAPKLFS